MMELIRPVLTRASNPLKRASPRALSQRFAARPRPLHQLAASRFRSQLRSSSAPSPAVAAYKQLLYRPFQRLNSTTSEAQPQLLSESSDSQPLTETSESQTLTETSESQANSEQAEVRSDVPAYELTFTCKPCTTRTTHRISKQGYHHGTVLITCPNCKSRHLITDHLKVSCPRGDICNLQKRRPM